MACGKYLSRKVKLLAIFGWILVVASVSSYFISDKLIKYNVEKNLIIKENSSAYKYWIDPPADIFRKYYVFDVQNPIEAQAGIAKPLLVQRGPYTYREKWEKKNIEFLGDELLSFTPVVSLHFEPELSAGLETDNVTFLNIPAVSMIEESKSFNIPGGDEIIQLILDAYDTELFVTHTVGELITGYEDPLLKIAKAFLPSLVKDTKFSILNGENGTQWQNYTIMTGVQNINDVGRIVSWDEKEVLDFWYSFHANLINGTDGSFYPPYLTRDKKLYAFNADMCRSYNLIYLRDSVINDVDVYDFHLPPDIFKNTTYNPDSDGFCEGPCLGNGVLNISKCYGGASGFISQPHFLNADDIFRDSIDGMKPNKDLHDWILHFEPLTGVPLGGNIRLQISFYVSKSNKISLVKNINSMLLPVIWFDETLNLFNDTLSNLGQVSKLVKVANIAAYVMLSAGCLLLACGVILFLFQNSKRKNASVIEAKRLTVNDQDDLNESSPLLRDSTTN